MLHFVVPGTHLYIRNARPWRREILAKKLELRSDGTMRQRLDRVEQKKARGPYGLGGQPNWFI